jgi:hypothetical protein
MRKVRLFALIVLASMMLAHSAFAAGTVTATKACNNKLGLCVITYDWTADASAATIPSTAGPSVTGYVVLVITDPGSTAPTPNYDITLTDAYGCDVMGGSLADRHTSTTEQALPKVGDVYAGRFVSGPLTLNITNNAVNSATGKVYVYVAE